MLMEAISECVCEPKYCVFVEKMVSGFQHENFKMRGGAK